MNFKSDKDLINSDFMPLLNYKDTHDERMKKMRKDDIRQLISAAFFIGLLVVVVYVLYKGFVMRGIL